MLIRKYADLSQITPARDSALNKLGPLRFGHAVLHRKLKERLYALLKLLVGWKKEIQAQVAVVNVNVRRAHDKQLNTLLK